MRALQTAIQTPGAMQQTAMCPDSWLWIRVEINLILPALFFLFIFFYFEKGLREVARKTHCPLGCRHVFVLASLLCPLSLQPNVTSWLHLPASGPCVELLRLFQLGRIQDNPAAVWVKRGRKTQGRERGTGRDVTAEGLPVWGLNFGQLLYHKCKRDFLDGGVLMARR